MKLIDLDKHCSTNWDCTASPSRENSEKAFNALAYTCFAVLAKTSADPTGEAKAFAKQLPTMLTRMSALFHRAPRR